MKGRPLRAPSKLPVILGKVLLRWIFTKADLVFFVYRFIWYACHLHVRSSMNSSVDFFESLIDEDGRFAELNCQEPVQRGQRQRPRPHIQGETSHPPPTESILKNLYKHRNENTLLNLNHTENTQQGVEYN